MPPLSPLTPEHWLNDLFASKAARDGAVIRRKLRDIERFVGIEAFRQEVARRGYRAYENAGQVVIFCNAAPIRRIG
ncbi:N-(5'-phosphoribosyl)anthranilate isomerase [Ponticoccus litoralis]|uniref:N-(5'-phosphoribosyl)anthranilate isomerase n=1 Tax=Ponticoccus litoralis TaxID=422297 RepID=A0AAW9SJW8_9RHOB